MKLSQSVQAVGSGEYETRIELHTSGELQTLANSFNLIAGQVGEATEQLHQE